MSKSFLLLCALVLPACGDAAADADTEAQAQAREDRQTLDVCAEAPLCDGEIFAQRIEDDDAFSMIGMGCVLEALRDRQEGMFEVELDWTYTNGNDVRQTVFAILPSGDVRVAERLDEWNDDAEVSPKTTYQPAQRCTLRPASFFDDCLAHVSQGSYDGSGVPDAGWDCVYPSIEEPAPPWFEGCVDEAASCE